MIYGFDFSHFNGDAQVAKRYPQADFVIHKISEGTSYVDPKAQARAMAWKGEKPTFWYHLIRPDKGTSSAAEAGHFVASVSSKVEPYGPFGLAIDLEAQFIPYNSKRATLDWIKDFLVKVKAAYNKPILVYMGDLYPDHWYKEIQEVGGLIWIARWGKEPKHEWVVWQQTSKFEGDNLDRDLCKLTISEAFKLTGPIVKISPEELAEDVLKTIRGQYGNGDERKKNLGDKYYKVQKIVNSIMEVTS